MKSLLVAFAFLTVQLGFGQNRWLVDSSYIGFRIVNAGIQVEGTFDGLNAQINFSPKKLRKSQVTASVDAGSVETGIRIRDKHLRRPEFFNVEQYPFITLSSLDIQELETSGYLANFILELKGKKEFLTIPFTFQEMSDYAMLEGKFKINRIDYGVGKKSLLLSDSVDINIWLRITEE